MKKVKIKYFSVIEFVSIFLVLTILSTLPSIMYGRSLEYIIFNEFTIWFLIYWLFITTIICCITTYQKRRTFSLPLMKLSQAAEDVSNGDFSVYIEPIHTSDKRNYIDVMFEDFNNMVKELGSIETMKNDFISNVSHELKTPLAVIQNYSTLLKDENLTQEERTAYLNEVIETTQKLSYLISNILRLNKLDNQEILGEFQSFDLCRQLCDCIIEFEPLLDQKDIELDIEIEDKAMIEADEELLKIVWNNIISNCIKFSEPHSQIRIQQISESDAVIVNISDNGCGMNEETLKHIFDKFYQGDTSHSKEGNGLGLALVYRIIEKMNGIITVTSQVNQGTTFSIRLYIQQKNHFNKTETIHK